MENNNYPTINNQQQSSVRLLRLQEIRQSCIKTADCANGLFCCPDGKCAEEGFCGTLKYGDTCGGADGLQCEKYLKCCLYGGDGMSKRCIYSDEPCLSTRYSLSSLPQAPQSEENISTYLKDFPWHTVSMILSITCFFFMIPVVVLYIL